MLGSDAWKLQGRHEGQKNLKNGKSESHPHFQPFNLVVPSRFAPETSFMEDSFSMDQGTARGMFWEDSSAFYLLCTLLQLLLHCNI